MIVGELWPWPTKVPTPTGESLYTFSSNIHPICFRSQFYITFTAASHLDKKHTVFGKLVGGEDVLDALEKIPVKPGTERPAKLVRITDVVM